MVQKKKKIELPCSSRQERPEYDEVVLPGRLPRITRLMALAIRGDDLIRAGKLEDMTHLAQICKVTQARISQILSLKMLAPDIQEQLLSLPRLAEGKPEITEKSVRQITMLDDWDETRRAWEIMRACRKDT